MDASASHVVVIQGLCQRYGRREVLHDVDLELWGAGVTGLVGPNGAGKSTLLATVCTLKKPAAGRVTVLGEDVSTRAGKGAIRRQLGYLPQSFGYVPSFTVAEFVAYAAWLKSVPASSTAAYTHEAIEVVGLEKEANKKLGQLSGGMLRRAGIAAAIVHRPRLLVLDEPTAGLDPEQRLSFRRLLLQLGERSHVILSTHLIEDVELTCGQVCVLRDGHVLFMGTPTQLVHDTGGSGAFARGALETAYAELTSAYVTAATA